MADRAAAAGMADAVLGDVCPSCGWTRGQHRPAGQWTEACPEAVP